DPPRAGGVAVAACPRPGPRPARAAGRGPGAGTGPAAAGVLRTGPGAPAVHGARTRQRRPGLPVGRHPGRHRPVRRPPLRGLARPRRGGRPRPRHAARARQRQHRRARLRPGRAPPVAGQQRQRGGDRPPARLEPDPRRPRRRPVAPPGGPALAVLGGPWAGPAHARGHGAGATGTVRARGGDAAIAGVVADPEAGTALVLDRDCRLWRATRTALAPVATLPGTAGDCVALDGDGTRAWAASEYGGVFLLDSADGRVLRTLPLATLLADPAPASALLGRRDGSVLVGFRDGRLARIGGP